MDAHKGRPRAGPDSIFDAAAICRAQLEQCSTRPALNEDHWARNRLADFSLWNAGVGATAKKHMSLDVRLQNDDAARSVVIGILSTLTAWTKKCSDLADDDFQPQRPLPSNLSAPTLGVSAHSKANEPGLRAASPTPHKDEDDESEITLIEAKNCIEELLHTLVVIGLAIRRAGTASRHRQADRTFESDSNTQDLKNHLEFLLRLPLLLKAQEASNASHVAGLLEIEKIVLSPEQLILLRATLKRRHRIRFAQMQGMKLKDLPSQSQEESTMPRQIVAPALDMSHIKISETAEGKSRDTPYSATALEKYAHSTVSKPSDYAAGQSLEQQIQTQNEGVAATIVAMHADYPKPPPTIDGIQVFQCPYCRLTLPNELLKTTGLWRNHVSEDIQPYTCFLPTCSMQNGNFNTLEAWKSHIQRDHRLIEYWRCLVCEVRFEKEVLLSAHIENVHADVIFADDLSAIVQMCLAYDRPRINICPVCSINKTDWAKNPKKDELSTILGTNSFLDHIGQCLHDFSLRSLPEETFAEQVHKSYKTNPNASNQTPRSYPASSFDFSEGPGYENGVDLTAQILHQIPKLYDDVKDFCVAWRQIVRHATDSILDDQLRTQQETSPEAEPGTSSTKAEELGQKDSASPRRDPKRKILIAVDFGKTFSALAYVDTLNPENRVLITSWGYGTPTADKTPTVIKYDNDGTTGPFKWGFQVLDGERRHEAFQSGLYLELDSRRSDLGRRYPSLTAHPQVYGETCEGLVVDFLKSLRELADDYLRTRLGQIIDAVPREYVITVSPIWSDKAKHTMIVCAEKAGMGMPSNIHLVAMPEAIAVYALDALGVNLHVNDAFIICDAGGEEVEVTSYRIVSALQIEEVAPGSGSFCGSSFINRIFARYIEAKFQDSPQWDVDYTYEALKCFEGDIKPGFSGSDKDYRKIKLRGLPDDENLGIKDQWLEIPFSDLRDKIFEPVVGEVVDLVKSQLHKSSYLSNIHMVLLAGGFGRNAYLQKRLEEETVGSMIKVLVIANSSTAVVQGALISGLRMIVRESPLVTVNSRIARRNLGTCHYQLFDEGKHDTARKVYNSFTRQFQIEIMQWFVQKGDTLIKDERQIFHFSLNQVRNRRPKPISITIFECEDDEPPMYRTQAVRECIKLEADITDVVESKLRQGLAQDGWEYYILDFELEMIMHSASMSFTLLSDGIRYHTVRTVEFL